MNRSSATPPSGRPPAAVPPAPWQTILAEAVRDAEELCRLLDLPAEVLRDARWAPVGFPLLVPRPYLARMRRGDPHDPLLRQVLPLAMEGGEVPGFSKDPLAEAETAADGLLTKYANRSLIVAAGACAVHCRYCFRRHFPYAELGGHMPRWEGILTRLAGSTTIHEVILSGGDPLTISDRRLAELAARLAEIPHLRRLRIHTRLPVVIPQRITDALLDGVLGTRLTTWVVIHVNHPAEIDSDVAAALVRLVKAGIPVLNQSVLLRGVNDSVEVMAELCERLIDLRIAPYYLHQLDRVAGASHFDVPEAVGREIIASLRPLLPGYAIPRYVREVPGVDHKRTVT